MAAASPRVSVVVPAHEAAETLPKALDSLLAQRYEEWEAIVVDDGSSDATASIAESYAARDHRLRVVRRAQGGASAARNTGIAAGRGEWLLLLDADDWLLPHTLERLVEIVGSVPEADAAFGLATRVGPSGEPVVSEFGGRDNLFRTVGRTCPFAIHSGVVRRSLVDRVGGFDLGLRTCGDWDLWQRVIRTGARIERVDEVVAAYRLRPQSLSLAARQVLQDGLEVIRRAHAPDPRVPDPAPQYAKGLPAGDAAAASLGLVGWAAGLALGHGDDALRLLDLVEPVRGRSADASAVAGGICLAVPIARGRPLSAWLDLWAELEKPLAAFATALEERLEVPGFSHGVVRALESQASARMEPSEPATVGSTCVIPIDLEEGVDSLPPLGAVERVHCVVRLGGEGLGAVEAPVCDGVVSATVLADSIAAELAWSIVTRLHHAAAPDASADSHWEWFLRELWGRDWPLSAFYDPRRSDESAAAAPTTDGVAEVEVAHPLPDVRTKEPVLSVIATLAGVPLGLVDVPARGRVARAQAIRAAITSAAGVELCRLAVREGVFGHPIESGVLRERLAEAARSTEDAARKEPPPAVVLGRRAPREIGSSVSRRADLPSHTAEAVLDAAKTAAEPVGRTHEDPEAVVYDPHALVSPFPPRERSPGLALRALRRVSRRGTTERLPILAYAGAPPDALDEHAGWLRANGYRTVSMREWYRAVLSRAPLRGRCVALTFDGGHGDFVTEAWPILRRHRFTATVLVPTDEVGGSGVLTWEDAARLQQEGVEFGTQSATRRSLTTLATSDVVADAARSRATAQRHLGRPVQLLAYPYGDNDQVVRHLVGAVGYVVGLSLRAGAASFGDEPLSLPRIEIAAGDSVEELAARLSYEELD